MPDQLFKSRAAATVLRSYLEAKAREEQSRKTKANDRLAIYHDDWDDILESILRSQFIDQNYKKIKLLKNTTQNILKKVVDDVSIVYKVAPTRNYNDNETIAHIYEYLQIDEFMADVNRYATLLNDVLIRVGWDDELKQITLDLQTPANTSIIQRDNYPQHASAVYYDIEYADDQFKTGKVNVFWSDFEHFLFDEKGNVRPPAEDNPNMINGYGKLPFVFIHVRPLPGMFWNPTGGQDLVNGTTITGMKRTLKDYLMKFQSFKQLWFRVADKADVSPEIASDPASAFRLTGENAEVGILDLTAPFNEMEQSLQSDINSFLATYGLSIDMFAASGEEASGRALNIKNRGLREIREKQLPIFRRVESQLFEMIRLVWNTWNPKAQIPEIEFKIDFAELETYIEPMEKRKQAQDDVKNGIISPGKYYMMFNPDVTNEEEAEKRMSENLLKYKNMKNQGFSFDNFFNQGGTVDGELLPGQSNALNPFNGK